MNVFSRFMKLAVVVAVTVLAMAVLSGCGSSDKFAGEWTGSGRYKQTDFDCFYDLKIEKDGNGNGYTIDQTRSYWNAKESISGSSASYSWQNKTEKLTANLQNNTLEISGSDKASLTYNEEKEELQYKTGDSIITLQKSKDAAGDLDSFKNRQKEELIDKLNKLGRNFSFTD